MKQYIKGAGGTIVTKSLLNGTSKLKWMFRQDGVTNGNGWVAFGDTDTQEYVDDANNMVIVDFNTLANIEPTVLNIFYLPVGADLEFRSDKTGKYFIDTKTGQEIREPVKSRGQIAFEKNLKFLNQKEYPVEFFERLFTEGEAIEVFTAGKADFPTGEVVLADPLAYLGTRYATVLDRRIPVGSYPVELAFIRSGIVGTRVGAARLVFGPQAAERYEIAMPKGKKFEEFGQPKVWTFFGVDTGLACFCDAQVGEEYREFFEKWEKENQGKNKYMDYFAAFFKESSERYPKFQRDGGNFASWQAPKTEHEMVLFSSGMGDGIYSGYWGINQEGRTVSLVVPFMNPEFF